MKTIKEIRHENICALVKKAGGVSKFADKTGKQPSQISQLVNQSIDAHTKKPKYMGSAQAREFENTLGLERGWFDHDHRDSVVGELALEAALIVNALPANKQLEMLHYLRFEAKKQQALCPPQT